MEAEKRDAFLRDLSKIEFMMFWYHSNSPSGTCVRIIYENGDFVVISSYWTRGERYAGKFDSQGNVIEFIGGLMNRDSLVNLINKYFRSAD